MSRVDEKRAEEVRLAQRRAKELQQKQRTAEASAFDRALAEKSAQRSAVAARTDERGRAAQGATAGEAAHESGVEAEAMESRGGEQKTFERKLADRRPPLDRRPSGRLQGEAAAQRLAEDRRDSEALRDRRPDSKTEDINKSITRGSDDHQRVGGAEEREQSKDQGSGGGKDQDKGAAQAFKLPPQALMAPPPVARPKDANAARLRAITKEIVEKIVSRVQVGTNAAGCPEFRIELKSSVLKGLSIRVSASRGGRITAVFSGSDRETLAALKQSSSELKDALAGKGLTLEELVVEGG